MRWSDFGKAALAAAVLSGAAVAQEPMQPAPPRVQAQPQAQPPPGAPTGEPAEGQLLSKEQFLAELNLANQWEIRLSEMAAERASHPQVKEFARMMRVDHQRAHERIQPVAKKEGVDLERALEQATSQKQQMLHLAILGSGDGLMMLTGAAFDRAYLGVMLAAHDLTIAKLHEYRTEFRSGQIVALINQTLPELEKHRDHAYRLLGELRPGARQARRGQRSP
jgi:predicted outer membrane protein